jgi:hypothetical protein
MRLRFPDAAATWSEGDARAVLDEWKRSGKSMAAFARQHGVTAGRLYWWRKRLQAKATTPAVAGLGATPPPPMSLVPASIVMGGASLMIRLPGEVSIDVTEASPSWVAAMVVELTRSLP